MFGAGDQQDPDDMAAELKVLRDEASLLRQRLEQAPTRLKVLEERLVETKQQLSTGHDRNQKL
ncbi:MAG: proteasome-associated ATPase, partial [Nitriliruptoraceae bacterium]